MLAAIQSAAVIGIDALPVIVEVDAAQGLPQWTIVGLPAGSVKEARDRVGAALVNSGFTVPPKRVTVNLAPADVRKEGTAFDLPIALGLLVATRQLDPRSVDNCVFAGELGLDGSVRPIRGALPLAVSASRRGARLVLPAANVSEASLVADVSLAAPADLRSLVAQLRNGGVPDARVARAASRITQEDVDWSDVVGQESAKRALEIAAAGGHNALLVGPPGAGKTMLARRLPTILPDITESEALEVIAIHSVAGTLTAETLASPRRPFRAPHHTISTAGLVGGGGPPRPGEASLAHAGVLFLDEMLEFPRHVLDAMRQPLEDGHVTIARASQTVRFPSRFTLVGATNPCPCGRAGAADNACTCSAAEVVRYRGRLSGPLADRMDMHVRVTAVDVASLGSSGAGERSASVRARVSGAVERQMARYRSRGGAERNAHVSGRWLDAHGELHQEARGVLSRAAARLGLTARGYHRALKVARTIADLDGDRVVSPAHVAEALGYRESGATV